MTKPLFVLSTVILFIFSSCQKTELVQPQSITNLTSTDKTSTITALGKGVVSDAHWYGDYYNMYDWQGNPLPGGDPDQLPVADTAIISGGVATMPPYTDPYAVSYFSFIAFDIPVQYNISGDSVSCEVIVKNPGGASFDDYDVVLTLVGAQNTAEVHFVAHAAHQTTTKYSIGSLSYTNLPTLVNYFSDFETIKLATKKGQTGVYVNNKLLYHFKYNTAGSIGRISTIKIAGAGIATVDNVKLTNSFTGKKLMQEDFNTDKQSHTIFY